MLLGIPLRTIRCICGSRQTYNQWKKVFGPDWVLTYPRHGLRTQQNFSPVLNKSLAVARAGHWSSKIIHSSVLSPASSITLQTKVFNFIIIPKPGQSLKSLYSLLSAIKNGFFTHTHTHTQIQFIYHYVRLAQSSLKHPEHTLIKLASFTEGQQSPFWTKTVLPFWNPALYTTAAFLKTPTSLKVFPKKCCPRLFLSNSLLSQNKPWKPAKMLIS